MDGQLAILGRRRKMRCNKPDQLVHYIDFKLNWTRNMHENMQLKT